MAIIKSFAPFLNLSNFQVFENDDLPQSEYFRITELNETLTGGKNGFLIEGSEHLKESTEVKIEILDVEGNPIYFEPGDGTPEYYEGNSKLIAVHVYDDTPIGIGKITILGELKTYLGENDAVTDIPSEWQGVYNVKWERSIQVNKNLSNETIVRFYKRPVVTIDEIVKPIITKTIPQVTQTGSLAGIPLNPPLGTDLRTWRAGIQYRLRIDDGPTWSASVDENIVSVPSLGYSAKIREILSKTDVVVDTPYTASDNTVTTLPSSDYSVTFDNKEASVIGESTLTGSFAKMNFSNLKTFVGDVARVKVFRKSRNAVGDFQFVQESKLESSELLRDITTSQDTELSYGLFDAYNLETYWVTSSEDHPVSIDNDVLMASVKTDYNESSGGTQTISTSGSFSISKDVEYTLNFRTLLSGALDEGGKSIRAYFSGSNYEQNFLTASGSAIYTARQNLTQNILATSTVDDVHLKFDISGSDWYISNVSLKNAQDTSFSPDEFTLIQDIPRKLAVESFDFKFEFYDINNNYIPVDVFATKEFDGGNDFPTSGQLLTFESDRNAFRFISGSVQNPENQTIKFSLTRANLTGSVTFASSAFDIAGNFLDPSDYTVYPGALTSVSPAGALITIDNFTGSRVDGSESPYVGSVVYTASLEDLEEFETIYRLEDGENAPQLIVTSNANQFIYEPTTLSAKPQGQSITISAKRKNLASFTTPITVNSGSGAPGISGSTDNTTGVDTYTIHSDYYSASFAGSTLEEVTYSFTGSDQFGIAYSDEVTISPVINFDGVSLVLSNESTAFPAKSTGEVEGGFASSKGNVQMFIGGNEITHDDIGGGRAKNTFDITSISGDNVTPNETSPTTNEYGISAFTNGADSGSLTLNIEYLAGDNSTSQSFQKVVSYSKSKKAVPNVEVFAQPAAQTINANSVGSGSSTPENIVVKAKEGNTDRFTSIGAITGSNGLTTSVSSEVITITSTASDMTSDTGVLQIPINFTDGEGTTGSKLAEVTVSRVRVGTPNVEVSVSPAGQTIDANSQGSGSVSPQTITVKALEGGTDRFTSIGNPTFSGGLTGSISSNTITFTDTASDMTSDTETISIPINFTDGEGTTGTKTVEASITRTRTAQPSTNFDVRPAAQTIAATSTGTLTGTIQDITIDGFDGNTALTYNQGTLSTGQYKITDISGVTVSDTTPSSKSFSITSFSGDTASGSADISFVDTEGTSGTSSVNFTLSKAKAATPVVTISANPQSQTVDSNSAFSSVGTPSAVTILVNEGGSNYTHTTSTVTANKFKITGVTNGTNNNNGTITPDTPTNADGTTSVVTLSYTNSEGTAFTSKTITVSVGVAVQGADGAQGAAGPGITFVGDCSDLASTFTWTSDSNTRQVTKVGTDYYITKDAADGVAKSTTGCPPNTTYFETMTSFASVATDVLFAQDVYANKTVNIGTSPNGTEPVIALNADAANSYENPYIGLGTTSFGSSGIFIGYDASTPKLSLVGGSGALTWNGTSLNVSGSVTATGGSIGGVVVESSKIYVGTGTVNNANTGFYLDSSGNFSLKDKLHFDGTDLNINGNITLANASSLNISAFNNDSGFTDDTVANTKTTAAAAASAANSADKTAGSVGGLNLTSTTMSIGGGNFNNADTGFFVNSSGDFSLKNKLSFTASTSTLSVDGTVTATAGAIGGWNLTSTQLEGGTVSGGGDGTNTSTGMIINSSGFISAPEFNVSSSGIASFSTSAKIGTAPLSSVFDPSGTDLRIKRASKIVDGSNVAAFSDAFRFESGTFKLNSSLPVFGSSTAIGSRFSTVETDITDLNSFTQENCVLPGTKIITKRGEVFVEETKENDLIKVFDFEKNEWGYSSIDEIIVGKSKGWSLIKTESGKELRCSKSHALYHPDFKEQTQPVSYLSDGSEIYVVSDNKLVLDKVKSIERFDEEVTVWNYHLNSVHNYISDGILSHNISLTKVQFTAGHQYVKLNSESIDVGDVVKLDSNNQIVKASTSKDTQIIGILWKQARSGSVYDSFGDELPENEMSSKTMWRVASIGDSFESGSSSLLPGFKVCNQGGDVGVGDLLCSSDTPGYLMKQPSEYVITSFDSGSNPIYEERQSQCSYTVAKCMEDVTFDSNGLAEQVYGYLFCG